VHSPSVLRGSRKDRQFVAADGGECGNGAVDLSGNLTSGEAESVGDGDRAQVKARAGTGKTTTIKEAFTHAPEGGRLLYAVFNKKNQREAQEKITDARVDVRTLHSLGYFFIKNVWRDAKPDDDVESYRLTQVEPTLPEEVATQVLKMVGFCKNLTTGIPDTNAVLDIADARGISVSDEMERDFPPARVAELAIEVLKQSLVKDHLALGR